MIGARNKSDELDFVSSSEHFAGGAFYFAAGAIFGVLALMIDVMIDAFPIVVAQRILSRDVCLDGFNGVTVTVIVSFGVISSLFVGRWLYGLRRMIGARPERGAEDWCAMIRRRFAWGSMLVFAGGTPVKWMFLLIAAYCGGGEHFGG